ncbi:TetR/AcrR family transcriptional regulator [Acidimicrobiia bacterium EGI L10123]|uniref:TetR/AcrR family transcriptional regulator n=1 Tax=Salinilacustrithrix flava TaxID=2957203 RepID=UPI003D7C35CB|nr:TetR/AcrR family transcriptional regulator [Acidimicrobiia bacterium EGI L10123]
MAIAGTTTRGAKTRQALLDAARERFARDGYRATSVADISRDAGVGGTTAFVHFENKEALFFAAVDDDLTSLFDELGVELASLGPEGAVPDRLLDTVLAIVERYPLARRLLAGLEPDVTERVLETESFAVLRRAVAELLAEGQEAGSIRPDLPAEHLADGLVAVVVAVAMASVQIGPTIPDSFGPGLATVLRGLLTPDPRWS